MTEFAFQAARRQRGQALEGEGSRAVDDWLASRENTLVRERDALLLKIEAQLAKLPQGRAPTLSDWQQISRRMRFEIDQRIMLLTRTRNQLDQCIGCGCLSLQKCQLYNKDDRMGAKGAGPRAILG